VAADDGFHVRATRPVGSFGFLEVEELSVAPPAGPVNRFAVRHPGAVAVVALHDDSVLLFREYRAPVDRFPLELPAGKLDVDGEHAAATAAREIEEEIGFRAGALEEVAQFYTAPGFTDEHMTLFVASRLEPVPASPHGPEEEHGELVAVPLDDVPALLASGAVADAKTVIGLQWLLLHRR
jgi:ADP-ribose pyrophosphatase